MRAAIYCGPRDIELADRPDPVVAAPTDAVVRVVLACVCGSDLWYYRRESPHALGPIGHEFIGVVEQVGPEVHSIAKGDLVVAPFTDSDGTCAHCRAGCTSSCVARPCAMVGFVGVPHGVEGPIGTMFSRNVGLRGGSAPVRTYIPQLLDDVLAGRIQPGRVFDFATDLDGIAEAYAAMDERRAIKSLVRVGRV